MKILILGEIVGRPGRQAVKKQLPLLREKYSPDLIISNIENLAHGIGITGKTVQEMTDVGINIFTSGNHIFKKKEAFDLVNRKDLTILRPANYPPSVPGQGYKIIEVRMTKVMVANMIGQVFIKEDFENPFWKWEEIKKELGSAMPKISIVDFHAEATSEKIAMGYYLDGTVSAVIGTHTHVPTQDFKILPGGTAYITDIGMIGPVDTVLGVSKETIIKQFLEQVPKDHSIPDASQCEFNAIFLEVDKTTGKTKKLEKIYQLVDI